ncbi:MAG: exopolysaccharide biosynthesis protein [Rhodospirillales bacterium]|nr:exopolysaccharide biosynthesis protein [Rhodospirillales bacterium]
MAEPAPPSGGLAAVLERLAALERERISLGEVADALRDRGFGLLFVVLALPNAIPGPALPGLSILTGLPLLFVALELALGKKEPELPRWIRRRSMTRAGFGRLVERMRPTLDRLERVIRPRYRNLTRRKAERLLGVFTALVALSLVFSLPTGNLLLGIGATALGLGLMERDGGAILVGVAVGTLGIAWNALLFWLGSEAFDWAWALLGW